MKPSEYLKMVGVNGWIMIHREYSKDCVTGELFWYEPSMDAFFRNCVSNYTPIVGVDGSYWDGEKCEACPGEDYKDQIKRGELPWGCIGLLSSEELDTVINDSIGEIEELTDYKPGWKMEIKYHHSKEKEEGGS